MAHFEAIVYDEVDGGTEKVVVKASTLDRAIEIIEGNPQHEYEIIEIERVNPWNAKGQGILS